VNPIASRLIPAGLTLLAFIAAAASWQTGCGGDRHREEPGAPPARVVSISPSATECAFALGLGNRLVGVTGSCNHPPEARALPKVGGPTADFERIVALRPDLVIGNGRMMGKTLDRIAALGIPTWGSSSRTLEDLFTDLENLARVLGNAEAGVRLAKSLRARCDRVRDALADVPAGRRPRILIEYWPDPLWTAGAGTSLDDAVTLAGGRNAASRRLTGWGTLAWETVLAKPPDLFLLAHRNRPLCARRPGWESLEAVRERRVVDVNRDHFARETPRMIEGIETLAKLLHPGEF
jgi:iron complex transport system substrate-binding protein